MKLYKQVIFILIVFFKTETLFSKNDLFSVNNIEIVKSDKISNIALANQAIEKGFNQLVEKILLKNDKEKLADVKSSTIKQLVSYYRISNSDNEESKEEFVSFSVTFDKDKIHDLFFKKGISYSKISDKELYILPILIKNNELNIFNNNFFYENWNEVYDNNLIEFVLPLENIEIIQSINIYKKSLINLDLISLFKEYPNKNSAIILIEESKIGLNKIYIKSIIQGKKISKNIELKIQQLESNDLKSKIITELKKELINLVKSENLIDIRTPSFLNVKLEVNKKSNLVELNKRIQNIDLIENIYVQDFNKNFMNLRIKYLGKLDNIISQLKEENINLQLSEYQWIIRTL
tara:strand:- start:198 stop:1244 length:1047 start_codon:yes stop_codon:yes gene_type:complete